MGPINNVPLGLLDLFGLRTLGQYPREVANFISPTIDVSLLQYNSITESLQLSETFNGAGTRDCGTYTFGSSGIVPTNEMWLVTHYHLDMLLAGAAVETGSAHLCWTLGNSNNPFFRPPARTPYGLRSYNGLDEMFTGNANGVYIAVETSAEPFILPSGAQLAYLISHLAFTAGAGESVVTYCNLDFVRLRR